jgi:hypothetical protein
MTLMWDLNDNACTGENEPDPLLCNSPPLAVCFPVSHTKCVPPAVVAYTVNGSRDHVLCDIYW